MDQSEPHTPPQARSNIDVIARLEEELLGDTTLGERIADRFGDFIGRLRFVIIHVAVVVVWLLVNSQWVDGLAPFDPYPFNFLSTIVSFESVLLTSFVLIKQQREGVRANRRSHLDLQVNLLTEIEVTRSLRMLRQISERLGIHDDGDDQINDLTRSTGVEGLARELHERLP